MKKYIVLALFLAGCAKPYTCMKATVNKNSTYEKAEAFCIANEDVEYMKNSQYTNADLLKFGDYVISGPGNSNCKFDRNARALEEQLFFGNYKFADGGKLDKFTNAYVCEKGSVKAYENYLVKQEELRIEEENAEKEQMAEIQKIEKEIGKKLCSYDEYGIYALYTMGTVPKNCGFKLGEFVVLQQTSGGTLITPDSRFGHHTLNDVYFISKNNTDSGAVDSQRIQGGYFENVGTYQYTATTGVTKTVLKLKRLSSIKPDEEY
ncbi:MAG: hypothetical protein JW985_01550 [Alphaproteobacteria bacterium]|nr:hypothetical protein [Alphaproteobacteria bacterium]